MNHYYTTSESIKRSLHSKFETTTSEIKHQMNQELNRLASFAAWPPNSQASLPRKLGKSGFYYTGRDDEVACFECGIRLAGWQKRGPPHAEHQKSSPSCPLVSSNNSSTTRNKPLVATAAARRALDEVTNRSSAFQSLPAEQNHQQYGSPLPSLASQRSFTNSHLQMSASRSRVPTDVSRVQSNGFNHSLPPYSHAIAPATRRSSQKNTYENSSNSQQIVQDGNRINSPVHERQKNVPTLPSSHTFNNSLTTDVAEPVFVQRSETAGGVPRHPQYATMSARMDSYTNWPSERTQTPSQMAQAGFFAAGHVDYVRCYFCHGGLHNWLPGDNPWIEHARWFPKCSFLLRTKGPAFIQGVKNGSIKETPYENGTSASVDTPAAANASVLTEVKHTERYASQTASNQDPLTILKLLEQEKEKMAEDNRKLREAGLCRVCKKEPSCTLFLPCGHLVTCDGCGSTTINCPQCGQVVRGTVRTYRG